MGFYGNITDTAKTQFQFDIIYPNRKAMDDAIHNEDNNTDGVHIGRFVLVSYGDIEGPEYSNNFNIDADVYGTRRGYDGTVWQKVFTNNTENYIMIAELNTIVPQFDIGAADAPSMVPLIPHFGADSTNIYYKLHWSPTWGFRVKAANANLCGPELNDDGSSTSNYVPMSADDKHYLSDENTLWHNRIGEDTYVFDQNDEDANQGIWTTDDNVDGIPAAIYYNKAGFNPAVISYGYNEVNLTAETYIPNYYYILNNGVYEKDLSNTLGDGPYYEKIDDHIQIEPTGYSGHLYNIENGEHAVSGSTTKVDTQELSIMLPTLGNTIAAIWDLIYGDRVVNNGDYRNLDIAWESARESLQRRGLRLVQDFDGAYQYKTKNVDTIAGAINSVHDLMGMIIISDTEQNLIDQIDTLSEDRIYYDQTNGTFKRKCRGYEYTEIDDTDSEVYSFVPVEVESEDYQAGMYYIENNNNYVLATGNFNDSQQYYLRSLQADNQYSLVEDITNDFNGLSVAYKEYFGKPGFYDYIRNEKYYNDKDYYTWTSVQQAMTESPLTDEYEANKFYYFDGNGFYLDAGEKPTIGRTYYQYKKENSHTVASLNKDGVYMANKYAYATDEGYEIDSSSTMGAGPYFELIPQETTVTETIYIKEETYEKVVFNENTQYVPYVYYIKVGTNEYDGPRTENTPQAGVDYYKRKVTYKRVDNQTKQFTVDASQPLENLIQFHTNEFYKKQGNNFIKIQDVADLENQDKFSIYVLRKDTDRTGNESNGGTYILNDVDFTDANETAMLKVTHAFYQPNIYYYQTVENPGNNEYSSYLLDVYPNKTINRTYYSFDSSQLVEANLDSVFEPYKYYLKTAEDRYELILTPTRPRNSQNQLLPFYKRNQTYYVVHDDANIYKHGSIWNYGITYVPSSVTLATREEGWQFKELKGFARDITTMHGLILKIKTLLDSDNEDTRDLDTVKGALNTLNDKIAKLDTWGSGQFIIVDDYGRLHGAEIVGQDGIKAEIDSNINNPKVIFSANFDGEEGIDASGIKLRNYELDEENTGNIEAMDSLEVALNKLENKAIDADSPIKYAGEEAQILSDNIQQFWQNYDNEWKRTLPYRWNTGQQSGLLNIDFGPIYEDNYSDGFVEVIGYTLTISETEWNQLTTLSGITKWYTLNRTTSSFEEINSPSEIKYKLYISWEDFLNSNIFDFLNNSIYLQTKHNAFKIIPLTSTSYVSKTYYIQINDSYFKLDSSSTFDNNKIYYELQNPIYSDSTLETFTLRELYDTKISPDQNFEYIIQAEDILAPTDVQSFWRQYDSMWKRLKRHQGTMDYYIAANTYRAANVTADTFTPQRHCYFDPQYHIFVFPLHYNSNIIQWYEYDSGGIRLTFQYPMVDSMIPFTISAGSPQDVIFLSFESWLNILCSKSTYTYNTQIVIPDSSITQVPIYYLENNEFIQTDEYRSNRIYYIAWQAFFDALRLRQFNDIYAETKEKVFKEITFADGVGYQPLKYYQKINNEFILDVAGALYNPTATYYELQDPIVEREREVMNTSLMDLCNIIYGVDSIYTTSSNIGTQIEDSNYYTLPNMPGKWELIHKKFKSLQIGETATEEPSETDIITWNADNTTIHTTGSDPTHCLVKREGNQIQLRLRWYSKGAASSSTKTIGKFNFQNVGLNSFGWADYGRGESDAWKAMLIVWIVNGSGNIQLRDVISMGTSYPTTEDVLCTATFNIIASNEMMDDSACDEFTFKRVS